MRMVCWTIQMDWQQQSLWLSKDQLIQQHRRGGRHVWKMENWQSCRAVLICIAKAALNVCLKPLMLCTGC